MYSISPVDWARNRLFLSINDNRAQKLNYSKYSLLFIPVVGIEPATSRRLHSEVIFNQTSYLECPVWQYSDEDEDNSPKILSEKNYQASSKKFRQMLRRWSLTLDRKFIYDLYPRQ